MACGYATPPLFHERYEVLHATPLSVKLGGAAFVPFQVPLKPGGELTVAPGAIDPL